MNKVIVAAGKRRWKRTCANQMYEWWRARYDVHELNLPGNGGGVGVGGRSRVIFNPLTYGQKT